MSVWDLKVTIFIYMSIGFCVALFPRLLKDGMSLFVIIFWVVMVPLLTIVRVPFVTFAVVIAFLFYIQSKASVPQRLFLFIALLAAVPVWFEFMIAAGATDIYQIRYWKLLVVFLLLPVLYGSLKSHYKIDFVDTLVVALSICLIISYLFFDSRFSLLSAIRLSIDEFLYTIVVYFVFSRVIVAHPRDSLLFISYGFIVLGLILAGVFIFNQVANADLYNVHSTAGNIYNLGYLREYRGGFLRAEGPLAGESMGLIVGAAAASLLLIRNVLNFDWLRVGIFVFFFWLACVITGSRGVMFTFVLTALVLFFVKGSELIKLLMVLLGVVAYVVINFGVPVISDDYGTFDFRVELFETSLDFIKDYPFGDIEYATSGYFDHLRRGPTQFLDIVSVYLEYLLPYGYLGFILLVLPFVITISQLFNMSVITPSKAGVYTNVMHFYIALLVGYMFMISTVSSVGLIDLLGLLFLAISRGVITAARKSSG